MSFGRRNNFMDPDFNPRRGRQQVQPNAATASAAANVNDNIPNGLLKTARQTGVINLANRDLTHVPDKIWDIAKAESSPTDVALDRAGDTGPRWWEMVDITKLLLSANRLESLSESISQLPGLVLIDLRDNRLSSLPDAICQLTDLRTLNASKNRLTELPANLSSCPSLVQLSLSGNSLTELLPDIGRIDSLTELDIADNQLICLPDSVAMLRCLRCLEAGGNRLESLPSGIAHLPALSRLGLAGNQLIDFPTGPYPALEVLDASDNRLTDLPSIGSARLKELRLINNRICRLLPDRLRPLGASLRHLELRRNCLTELPVELPGLLPLLERIDLADNGLSGLPNELGLLASLKCILLDGNPLRALRREVVARGTEAIKKHLASRIAQPAEAEAAVEAAAAIASAAAAAVAAGGSASEAAAAASAYSKKISNAESAPKTVLQALQQEYGLDLNELRVTKTLKYTDKRVAEVPEALIELLASENETNIQLIRLDLSGNDLTALPKRLTRPPFSDTLQHVSIRKNKLVGQLEPGVTLLCGLTMLDLSVNQLSSLPSELTKLCNLRDLILSYNRFVDFPEPVYNMPNLQTLLLANNGISSLAPYRLSQMTSLSTLDLTNNNLATVPPQLGLCAGLKNLHLEGNRFRVPRPDQLAKGSAFVLEYLRSRIAS